MEDDVGRLLLAWLGAGDIRQGDQAVEAFLKRRGPGRDGGIDRVEVLLGDAGLGLDGDRQVGVVPGVAVGIVVVEDDQRLGVGLGQMAVVPLALLGAACADRGERSAASAVMATTRAALRSDMWMEPPPCPASIGAAGLR